MSTPITPMMMIPKMSIPFKLYFLAFPPEWKALILKMHLTINPKFSTLHNLKTNVLYGYLNGWLDDVVKISPMKQASDDSHWLTSASEPDIEKICEIMKIWITAEYLQNSRKSAETEKIANELLAMISPDTLKMGIYSEEKVLFDEENHALTDYAFDAFALYAVNALNGKTITIYGKSNHENFTFWSCGSKMLMSRPVSDGKKKASYYALSLQLSVQTTPPERTCMLLVDCSVKRFISNCWKNNVYLKEKIHAYVAMGNHQYRRIALKEYPHVWSKPEQDFYNLYSAKILPEAEDVLHHPELYITGQQSPQILLPFKNGMKFTNSSIGTGVPIVDKRTIFQQICSLMQNFTQPFGAVYPISPSQNVHLSDSAKKKLTQKDHRERMKSCTGMPELTIEIYGHEDNAELTQNIIDEIEEYFGDKSYQNIFPINVICKNLGELGDMMPDNSYISHYQRIDAIKRRIPKSDKIIGAIIILADTRDEKGDPKYAIRAGFADTNRLTQFITPDKFMEDRKEKNSPKERIPSAVRDLLRQFGYTEFLETKNTQKNPAFDADAVGICVLHQLRPLSSKETAKELPIYVTYQVRSGQLVVDCDLLDGIHISYPEALLHFSRLSREPEFVQKCVSASRGELRTKLLGLQSRYHEKSALILVQANGLTRELWHGLSDKKIAEYQMNTPYMPLEIEIGKKDYSYMRSFLNTGIRIMRIRENQSIHEVPNYFTDLNKKGDCISASGIYQYQSVFWGLESRPYNKEYTNSYRKSKVDDPSESFDECSLIEYYPMQLQSGDDAEQWVAYTNYLREVLPETKRSVRLPAPLHFAELMKEYLLLKK